MSEDNLTLPVVKVKSPYLLRLRKSHLKIVSVVTTGSYVRIHCDFLGSMICLWLLRTLNALRARAWSKNSDSNLYKSKACKLKRSFFPVIFVMCYISNVVVKGYGFKSLVCGCHMLRIKELQELFCRLCLVALKTWSPVKAAWRAGLTTSLSRKTEHRPLQQG